MASATGFASLDKLGCGYFSLRREFSHVFCSRVPVRNIANANSKFMPPVRRRTREFMLFHSVGQDRFLTSVDEEEMGDGFFETIEEMERMAREPSDILGEMNERLSPRELQLMLVYFSQEGRDSWCALEVFEWLNKENRVDKETMELMVSIMCGWVKKLIQTEVDVGQVVDLLVDMDCVGLKPNFSMMEKVISVYWETGKKDQASLFVEEVLRRGITGVEEEGNGKRERPAGYLAWKMMLQEHTTVSGNVLCSMWPESKAPSWARQGMPCMFLEQKYYSTNCWCRRNVEEGGLLNYTMLSEFHNTPLHTFGLILI